MLSTGHESTYTWSEVQKQIDAAVKHDRQQRTWVELTDEEMLECNMDGDFMIDRETAKRNVESKLREKNNG